MYDFAFYFFYGILKRWNDETILTSILGVSIILLLHILAVVTVLGYYEIIPRMPVFSKTYFYNKMAYFIPMLIYIGFVFLLFPKRRVSAIIDKYSKKEDFFTFGNILLFLLMFIVPSLVIAKFK